jgi:hypothetical protein
VSKKGKKSNLREEAEAIVDAYCTDVLTGDAPGITLADMIEVSLADAVAAAWDGAAKAVLASPNKKSAAAVLAQRSAAIRAEVKP